MKWKGREKGWRSINIKNNYKKVGKKKKKKTLKLERLQLFKKKKKN